MDTKLTQLMLRLWSSACEDRPERPSCQVTDGTFVLTVKGNRGQWAEMVAAAGVPSHATQEQNGEMLICTWPSIADHIFGEGGLMAQHLPNYEVRLPQIHMSRMVQRSIEMAQPAVIEAGTGTGKSFAYAAICMAMGKRVAISTSNKALQLQLVKKDVPFLQTLFPGKRLTLVVGKNNFACRTKVEDLSLGAYAITGDLLDWYLSTDTGIVEEIQFAVEREDLAKIVPDRYCPGKACSQYGTCFYFQSKAKRAEADVLVCNHALLALHQLYPGAGILPPIDIIVVDESHKFPDYMRNAVGSEVGLDSIRRRIELAAKHNAKVDEAEDAARRFYTEIRSRMGQSGDREIGVAKDDALASGLALAEQLAECAEQMWHDGDMPENPEERRRMVDARTILATADAVGVFSRPTRDGFVRWIENADGALTCTHVPFVVSEWIGRMAGFAQPTQAPPLDHTHCARCGRTLTAKVVNVLEGLPYGPDCIHHVDPFGDAEQMDLEAWLNREQPPTTPVHFAPTPVVFTSATLAAPDMDAFLREAGLPHALQMVAASPFDYESHALLYIPPAAAPAPNKDSYRDWLTEEMDRLVKASGGGAFLLFTSYANMTYVSQRLRWGMEQAGLSVFVQGTLPKLEIVKRFVATGNGVLFATKSFWEGVSIDGQALRLVCIDKMPFEAPSPLNQAQEAALKLWSKAQGMSDKEADWYPFEALRVPKMVIDLKQGTGRLIRTQTDWGVIAILDSRLRAAQYARRLVLPSLPPARRVHELWEVDQFFHEQRQAVRLADMTALQQAEALYAQEAQQEELF